MAIEKKKLAAISAALFTYITTEEQAALSDSVSQNQGTPDRQSGVNLDLNIWGNAGRQYQMQLNSMIQMRAFK